VGAGDSHRGRGRSYRIKEPHQGPTFMSLFLDKLLQLMQSRALSRQQKTPGTGGPHEAAAVCKVGQVPGLRQDPRNLLFHLRKLRGKAQRQGNSIENAISGLVHAPLERARKSFELASEALPHPPRIAQTATIAATHRCSRRAAVTSTRGNNSAVTTVLCMK
jgi:hypothetical protein